MSAMSSHHSFFEAHYRLQVGLVWRKDVDGKVLILPDDDFEHYYEIDGAMAELWPALCKGRSPAAAIAALCAEHKRQTRLIQKTALKMLKELLSLGFIETVPEQD